MQKLASSQKMIVMMPGPSSFHPSHEAGPKHHSSASSAFLVIQFRYLALPESNMSARNSTTNSFCMILYPEISFELPCVKSKICHSDHGTYQSVDESISIVIDSAPPCYCNCLCSSIGSLVKAWSSSRLVPEQSRANQRGFPMRSHWK